MVTTKDTKEPKEVDLDEIASIVGSLVWYSRADASTNSAPTDLGPDPDGQPLAAVITHVTHAPGMKAPDGVIEPEDQETRVNLAVFTAHGGTYGRQDILLITDLKRPRGLPFAEWPKDAPARRKADEEKRKKDEEAAGKLAEAKTKDAADAATRIKNRADALDKLLERSENIGVDARADARTRL